MIGEVLQRRAVRQRRQSQCFSQLIGRLQQFDHAPIRRFHVSSHDQTGHQLRLCKLIHVRVASPGSFDLHAFITTA
jgi:hypothetical protein